jgi:hypothetical protein
MPAQLAPALNRRVQHKTRPKARAGRRQELHAIF